jgi:hypothetical protein
MGDVHRTWIRVIRCNKATRYIDLWATKTSVIENKILSENNSVETESTLLKICSKQSRNESGTVAVRFLLKQTIETSISTYSAAERCHFQELKSTTSMARVALSSFKLAMP